MHNRGDYKNRVYFSHGDFTEGFMFCTYPNPIGSEENRNADGVDSGWFEIKGKLLKEFNRNINTGKIRDIELTDEHGKKHQFSKTEIKMLQEQYLNYCFERLSDASDSQQRKIVKKIGLLKLAKAAGAL